jgi:hypothetical protein
MPRSSKVCPNIYICFMAKWPSKNVRWNQMDVFHDVFAEEFCMKNMVGVSWGDW